MRKVVAARCASNVTKPVHETVESLTGETQNKLAQLVCHRRPTRPPPSIGPASWKRSAATASARRKSRYTSETSKSRPSSTTMSY
jgi:hypothetical protein